MRISYLFTAFILFTLNVNSQKISCKYTTESEKWIDGKAIDLKVTDNKADIVIDTRIKLQEIEGFGACFNELGWEALLRLDENERERIMEDLFSEEGVNFTLCRMPLGSNDYSLSYYSCNDVPEDFEMKNFNIDRDRYILIPYIKAAMAVNPGLRIWASPWGPPAWMKVNRHYAMGANTDIKRMDPGKTIPNNATAFRMEIDYLDAYSLYFSKFVKAYQKEGIDISMVMVQNEPVYQPHWQSCTWRPEDLAFFIGKFLGPRFESDTITAGIWLGTVNSSDPDYTRTILDDREANKYIKGIGFQWDAKHALPVLRKEYPGYPMMQTESECGNGENNWGSAEYTWSLINHYFNHGINSYMYWNMVLDESGRSTWGWSQNMMIAIDKQTGEITYNPEYYLMKHLSHFVLPGARLLKTSGGKDHLAFENPDGEIVLILFNLDGINKRIILDMDGVSAGIEVKANSINSIVWNR